MAKKQEVKNESTQELRHNIHSYQSLIKPIITEKSYSLFQNRKYSFEVDKASNKQEIAKAVELLYNVKVSQVRVINIKPRNVFIRGKKGKTSSYKKAIVSLKEGYSITI
ncbi:MAG: 50S ribosomal protein L23 [Candidatus Paceibacterota bacterium]